jgi:hypothetical protein
MFFKTGPLPSDADDRVLHQLVALLGFA